MASGISAEGKQSARRQRSFARRARADLDRGAGRRADAVVAERHRIERAINRVKPAHREPLACVSPADARLRARALDVDTACRLTISRFWCDRGVFEALAQIVLPTLADLACARGERVVRCWNAGCASGEEAYSVRLAWEERAAVSFPGLALHVLGTDAAPRVLERARIACFPPGALRDLPTPWTERAFERRGALYYLRFDLRGGFAFRCEDLRRRVAEESFRLVLCRNVAFTYFSDALQRDLAVRLTECIPPGGALLLGAHEQLPASLPALLPWPPRFIRRGRRYRYGNRAAEPACRRNNARGEAESAYLRYEVSMIALPWLSSPQAVFANR